MVILIKSKTIFSTIIKIFADGPFEFNLIRLIAIHTLQGLSYMHSINIVHLDIKSNNVMVTHSGIKICDFGLACTLPVHNPRQGTLHYMAPELIMCEYNCEYYTTKCDVWSFGIMMLGKILFKNHSEKIC